MQLPDQFKDFYLSPIIDMTRLPENIVRLLEEYDFLNLIFFKIFKQDKFLVAVQQFVEKKMGRKYVEVPNISLKEIYADSNCRTPLIILLSQGSDPKADFDQLAQEQGITEVLSISLG